MYIVVEKQSSIKSKKQKHPPFPPRNIDSVSPEISFSHIVTCWYWPSKFPWGLEQVKDELMVPLLPIWLERQALLYHPYKKPYLRLTKFWCCM